MTEFAEKAVIKSTKKSFLVKFFSWTLSRGDYKFCEGQRNTFNEYWASVISDAVQKAVEAAFEEAAKIVENEEKERWTGKGVTSLLEVAKSIRGRK